MERGFPREEGAPTRGTQFINWLTSGTVSGAAAEGSTVRGWGGEGRCHMASWPEVAESTGCPDSEFVCCYSVLSLVLRLSVYDLT